MALSVKKITIWSREIGNQPGTLGAALGPLAQSGCDLQVCMAYAKPGDSSLSVAEIAPVAGIKATRAAQEAGFTPSSIPCLVVEGDNRAGLGRDTATALGAMGLNIHFLVTLVTGKRYRTILGFGPDADLAMATKAIRAATIVSAARASRPGRRLARRKKAARPK